MTAQRRAGATALREDVGKRGSAQDVFAPRRWIGGSSAGEAGFDGFGQEAEPRREQAAHQVALAVEKTLLETLGEPSLEQLIESTLHRLPRAGIVDAGDHRAPHLFAERDDRQRPAD